MISMQRSGLARLTWILLLACLIFVTGCVSREGSCRLLSVREYDPEFTAAFAMQLDTIPGGSPVAVFIVDQVSLRDAVRACRGEM